MAALVRHGAAKFRSLTSSNAPVVIRFYASKAEKKKGIDRRPQPKIEWTAQSLASKGFLRSQKEYNPPEDIHNKLLTVFKTTLGSSNADVSLGDPSKKFEVLNACSKEFGHDVPNSLLHTMETLADVAQYYKIPVCNKTPLDKMQNMDLPPNLHVQHEYHRFHPETDKLFNGRTAFPGSSTLVTGLKYKDKYKGHIQPQQYPYES